MSTLSSTVYVENYADGTISTINTGTHTVTATYAVGNTPAGMTFVGTDLYISRFTDGVVSIFDTVTHAMKTLCVPDTTPPTFTMQMYADAGLTTPLADNASLKAGTYYVKISADEALSSTPTISLQAEGTANDVTDAATTLDTGNNYKYTYVISTDVAAVGSVLADFSITGTDANSNTATNVSPTNEATKAPYTDTTADAAPGTPDMTAGTDTGTSSTDSITSNTTPSFTMTCVTGSTVTLYDNVTSLGTGTCVASTVTITSSALTSGTHATIHATQTDPAGNVSVASGDLSVTIDTGTPTLSSYTPTGNIIGLETYHALILTFSENIAKGTGNITLYKSSDNSTVEIIDVTNIGVTVSGGILTIPLATTLDSVTGYYVQIPATAVRDLSGNAYAGIADTTTFAFQ